MSATITDEQFAARELVRSWASSSAAVEAARDVEHGRADAWRAAYQGLAELGIFGVALPEEHGGAGGTVDDLCAMVDEAAAAMVPGPIATTALATLVIGEPHAEVLEALASGERTAGVALSADLRYGDGRVSGTADYVLGADPHGVLLLPAGDEWLLVDATADGVTIEPLKATDFSRPLARVLVDSAPAEVLAVAAQRVEDLAATVLAAEAAGLARWTLQTATEYAKVREQFGKPIGSFQAIKHMCAEMLLRSEQISVAAADAAEGGWKLTGQKVWTSRADWAQWGVCLARTDADAPKQKGITYFLVDMKSRGIDIRPLREITGDNLFNEVFFDDVFVPDEMVVGRVNDGWRLARTTLANERVAMAHGTALGNPMEELLRTVTELDLDPAVQDRLGELIRSAQVGSLLDQRIALLAVGGQDPGPQASARKLIGVRYRQALSEFRMELSEGAGVVENQPVHDFLNTRCLTIAGGTEQILLTLAGERLLGLPR